MYGKRRIASQKRERRDFSIGVLCRFRSYTTNARVGRRGVEDAAPYNIPLNKHSKNRWISRIMIAAHPLTVPCVRRWVCCEPETRKTRFEKLGGTVFRALWKQYERRQYRVYGKRRIASQNREGFVPYAILISTLLTVCRGRVALLLQVWDTDKSLRRGAFCARLLRFGRSRGFQTDLPLRLQAPGRRR